MFDLLRSNNLDMITVLVYILSSVAVIFLTLPIHEFAHAYTATKLGDPTPRYQGRLTLNPFAHIDYLGALLIILIGFGWAKPVQVDARYFKNAKRDMAITAIAGPLSNIILAFIMLIIIHILYLFSYNDYSLIVNFFQFIASINIYLAVFNLIPIPPLDGSRLLSVFLPDRQYYRLMQYERYFFIAIVFLMFSGVLNLSYISASIYNTLSNIAGLPFKLF